MLPTRDQACNPGMCPDWESNPQPFGSQVGIQSTEPHQPGFFLLFCFGFFCLFFVLKAVNAFYTTVIFLSCKKQVRSGVHEPFLSGWWHYDVHTAVQPSLLSARVQNFFVAHAETLSPLHTDSPPFPRLSLGTAVLPSYPHVLDSSRYLR
ncbi:hypothetical protein HJG60_009467 [Phyllostomus discolor]|uniref:Uncharacterized protein n=1 Tax=Phyllostomus discolor TaxID=89673 RepID=A0A833YGI7_9CHIR|nr:hypothetical protein HJG60_009467 [Phyllostomus discolor]